jgi:hypothetical protein
MGTLMRRKEAHHRYVPLVGFALFLTVLLLPQIAFARIFIQNHMEGSVAAPSAGPELYAYHQGDEASYDLEADFDLGTYDDTEVDATGTLLQIAAASAIDWWDTDWGARRCFDIMNGDTLLAEHQVRIVFDSTSDLAGGLVQADGADYRAIADDDVTQLPIFVESGVGTADTTVWVQMDLPGFSTTQFCLYFDNATATTVSSEGDVFSYSAQRELYFPAWWRFDGSSGNDGTVDIVSYVDNNMVTVGGTTAVLNAGDVQAFTGITVDTQILSTGPLGGRGRGQGMDSIVPISFAGTDMVFPTNRSNQRWTLVAPTGGTATVDIYNGTTLAWSGSVGGVANTPSVEVSGGRAGIIRSTNGVPIIVTHTASNNSFSDAMVVPPFYGDDVYGVRSRNAQFGFDGAGSVDVWMDDGTITTVSAGAGAVTSLNNGADFDGNGTAMRLTNFVTATGGIQQADRDGFESTAFLPERLLDSVYYLPSDADYIAFACPTAMTINVGAVPVSCSPPSPGFPGHAVWGAAVQGTEIRSTNGEPFFAYYEDRRNQDETNLLGMKSAWAFSNSEPIVSQQPIELLPASPLVGTWTSPVIDTLTTGTNVFGLLDADVVDLPTGTAVTMQVARGATPALALSAPFVGPDGTSGTTFTSGENPIPYVWDFGDAYYVVRVELTTTTSGVSPTVDAVRLGYDLPQVSMSSLHVVETGGTERDRDWVLRIWTEDPNMTGAGATLSYLSSTGLTGASQAQFSLDGSAQIQVVGTSVPQTSGPSVIVGPGLPHSIVVDTRDMNGVDFDAVWQAQLSGTGILIPHEVRISFI